MDQSILDHKFFISLIDDSCGLICVVDEKGMCQYINKRIFEITGFRPEELMGKHILEYLHDDDFHVIKNVFIQLKSYKKVEAPPFRIITKSGEWKWMEAVFTNVNVSEHIGGYMIEARDVTNKYISTEKLEEIHSFSNSLFKNHPDAVFTLSPDGIFEQVNSKVSEISGYSKQEMVGEHFSKFIAVSFLFDAIKAIMNAGNGQSSSLEGKIVSKEGRVLTLSLNIIPIFSKEHVTVIFGTAKDITAEKQALKEIEKLSLIASKGVNGVIITDAAGRIEWVNSEFTRVTGYTIREALGKKPGVLLQGKETDPKTVLEVHKMLRSQRPFSAEILNYRKNREKFWVKMDIAPLFDDEGKVSKFFAIESDITERKESERKTLLLAEDLTKRNRELQQFNYIVSHNLRAPVANILGLVSILDNPNVDSKTLGKATEKIKETSESLDNVIKDLDKILSTRNDGNGTLDGVVNIKSICQDIIKSLQEKIDSVGASIQVSVPDDVSIWANRAYVYSIFHNLLSNSLKYVSNNRPVVVNIAYRSDAEKHTLIIEDNGAGMDLTRFGEQIFKLYGKFDKKAEGRGLGLYMVKTQVEALGGTIDVSSTPGAGTTFYVSFNKVKGMTGTTHVPETAG